MLGAAHGTARCELVERSGSGDAKIQVPHGHAGDERAGKHGGDQIHDAVGAAQIDGLQVGEERIPQQPTPLNAPESTVTPRFHFL